MQVGKPSADAFEPPQNHVSHGRESYARSTHRATRIEKSDLRADSEWFLVVLLPLASAQLPLASSDRVAAKELSW